MVALFFLLISAQVPDSDEQFVPDFHSENCEYPTLYFCVLSMHVCRCTVCVSMSRIYTCARNQIF